MEFKYLRRFPVEKQDQVEQLINYATLMGLSGEDLISIGGRMRRDAERARVKSNMDLIAGVQVEPIGRDDRHWRTLARRFKIRTVTGAYNFEQSDGGGLWRVNSLATKTNKTYRPIRNDLAKSKNWDQQNYWNMLLAVANGQFPLDF